MTITIGRCVLPDPRDVSSSGGVVSMGGLAYSTATLVADRAAEMQAREMQLLGMVGNPDEDVFPLVWTAEARYNGFYRVLDATWTWVNDGSSRASVANWSITLEAIADSQSPMMETTSISPIRTNAFSYAPAGSMSPVRPWIVPGLNIPSTGTIRTTADGVALGFLAAPFSRLTEPDKYFDAVATLELLGDDSVWYPWTGRDVATVNPLGGFRITNGLVRFSLNGAGLLTVANWDGTAWREHTYTASLLVSVSATWYDLVSWSGVSILRNGVDAVTVRLTLQPSSSADTAITAGLTVDVTVRAGLRFAEIIVSGLGIETLNNAFGLTRTAAATWTLTSDYLIPNANDANGHRSFVAMTRDCTIAGSRISGRKSAEKWSGCIGMIINFSTAPSGDNGAQFKDEFFLPPIASTKVLAR
jgi:hypothetical protein